MKRLFLITAVSLCVSSWATHASMAASETETGGGQAAHGLDPLVLLAIAVLLLVAKLGGELFTKLN